MLFDMLHSVIGIYSDDIIKQLIVHSIILYYDVLYNIMLNASIWYYLVIYGIMCNYIIYYNSI